MPKRAIAQLFLDRLNPPKAGRVEFWDSHQPGLCLRVSATGAKSWVVMYRVGGRQVRETLGTLAQIPKVDEARRRALASLAKARAGINPVNERRFAAERGAANTVTAAVKLYLTRCERDLRPKTVQGYRQLFAHDVLPRWGDRPLASISKKDVIELIHDKAAGRERTRNGSAGGAVSQANHLRTRLRTFFTWAVAHNLVAFDPSAGVMRAGRERPRDRVLTDDEIRAFWGATGAPGRERHNGVAWGALFRLLLLTAQRKSEVAGMRWTEIDLDARIWEIPGTRTKNGKPHTLHLNELAVSILASLPRCGELVFSGTRNTPTSGFSRAKRKLDLAMGPLSGWVIHDLRRTATTGMARLGIAPHVADKALNHTAGTIGGVAAIYNKFQYLDERKSALEAWGRFVGDLVGLGATNATALRRA